MICNFFRLTNVWLLDEEADAILIILPIRRLPQNQYHRTNHIFYFVEKKKIMSESKAEYLREQS